MEKHPHLESDTNSYSLGGEHYAHFFYLFVTVGIEKTRITSQKRQKNEKDLVYQAFVPRRPLRLAVFGEI
jgi:hypothetical protein